MNYVIQNFGECGELSAVTCFCYYCAFSKLDPNMYHFIRNKIQALVTYVKVSLCVPLKSFCSLAQPTTKPNEKQNGLMHLFEMLPEKLKAMIKKKKSQ